MKTLSIVLFKISLKSNKKKNTMETNKKKKKHADFQDPYRRSSNFRRTVPKEKFILKEDGDLKLDPSTED